MGNHGHQVGFGHMLEKSQGAGPKKKRMESYTWWKYSKLEAGGCGINNVSGWARATSMTIVRLQKVLYARKFPNW